jgi:hypothetical protein
MSNILNIRNFGLPPLFWDVTQSMDCLTLEDESGRLSRKAGG